MAYGTVNADVIGTSVAGSNLGAGNASIMKNRIINGAMVINQRGFSGTAAGVYTLDRWKGLASGGGVYSVEQSTTAPAGFVNSLLATVTTTDTSLGTSDYYFIQQLIEGYNIADLGWGTANAKTITISFWVRSSLTGSFGGSLMNSAYDRSYPFSYTISAANTWEQKTVTIAGDTTGTWLTNNDTGIRLHFALGLGSNYLGTAGAWTASEKYAPTGSVNVLGTSGATFYITGVQLEVGSSATGYEYRQYGTELSLCQRYYAKMKAGTGAYTGFGSGYQETTSVAYIVFKYPTTMRSSPTFSQSNCAINDTVSFTASASLSTTFSGSDTARIRVTFSPSGGAVHRPVEFLANNDSSAYFDMSAEL